MVKLEDRIRINNNIYGTIKYIGELSGKDGIWIGCELDEPTGKNNGMFDHKRYFVCKDKHGIFIRKERIKTNDQITLSEIEGIENNARFEIKNLDSLVKEEDDVNNFIIKGDVNEFDGDDYRKENDDIRRILQENLDASKITALNEKLKELKDVSKHKINVLRTELEEEKNKNNSLENDNKRLIREKREMSMEISQYKKNVADKIKNFKEEVVEILNTIQINLSDIGNYGIKIDYNRKEYDFTCHTLLNLIRSCLENNEEKMNLFSQEFKKIMKKNKIVNYK